MKGKEWQDGWFLPRLEFSSSINRDRFVGIGRPRVEPPSSQRGPTIVSVPHWMPGTTRFVNSLEPSKCTGAYARSRALTLLYLFSYSSVSDGPSHFGEQLCQARQICSMSPCTPPPRCILHPCDSPPIVSPYPRSLWSFEHPRVLRY